jgi:spermidine synthase
LALFTIAEALSLRKRFKALSLACSFGSIFAIALITTSPGVKSSTMSAGLAYLPATKAALEQMKNEQKYLDFRFYRDGMNSTISVEESKLANIRVLKSDGKVEATIPIAKPEAASGSDLATQTMLCLLPTLIHDGSDLRCLIIGLGSGTTSSTASERKQIKTIDVVEIEPAVVEAAKYFQSQLPKKLNIIQSDARAHLKSAAAYDLIISQPSEPWVAGSSALFTVEFFRLMRQKLNQDGLVTQWLQLYGLSNQEFLCALKTFTTVFPDTLIFHQKGAGEILLVGANSPKSLAQIDSSAYKRAFLSDSGRAAMARAGIDSWETFRNEHLIVLSKEKPLSESLAANLTDISLNSDDNLLLEYSRGRYLANKEGASEKQLAANLAILENKKNNATIASSSPDKLPNPEALDRALALDPSAYLLLNLKGKRLLQENQAELALYYLNRSKSLNPCIEETRELLALALTYLGKVEEGLQETQAAHLINNKSPMPYLIAACIYQIEGNGAEARLNLNKAKQNCPENEILNQIAALQLNDTGTLKSLLIRLSLAL